MSDQPTTAVQPQMIALARINVAEGHNPRSAFEDAQLAELAASIAEHGVLSPILVSPDEQAEGEFRLVAGERRYRAACDAALVEIPALVRQTEDGDALDLAITENVHRVDLNPVDEARAYARQLKANATTQAKLAEGLKLNPRRVSESLRLLRLPEAVQEHIAAGALPTSSAKTLEKIAKVSEPVACAVAQLVATDENTEPVQLEQRPGDLVRHVAASDPELVCVPVEIHTWWRATDLPLAGDQVDEITQRAAALADGWLGVGLAEDDVDAARAYGCLLEFEAGGYWASQFVCDGAFLADRVRLMLDELEREIAEQEAARQQAAGARGAVAGAEDADRADGGVPVETTAPVDAEAQAKQAAEAERQERIDARGANLQLGRQLAEKFHEPKLTKDVARLLALCVLDRETSNLAARGLRYVREDWQADQSRTLKSGGHREKIAYPEPYEAEAALWEWFERARSAEQMIGPVLQALIAAHHADETAVARSKRAYYSLPGRYASAPMTDVAELVEKLAKRLLAPRIAEQLAEAQAQRAKWATDTQQD